MSLIKAFAQLKDVTAGDTGLGIDYALDVLELSWRQVIETDDRSFFVYPSNDSIAIDALWKSIGQDAAARINAALVASGNASLATCTFEDVFVHGFGDWKAGSAMPDIENLFTGLRERVHRIPRNLGSVSQITNAQETIPLLNNEQRSLRVDLQFTDTPNLGTQIEYRQTLYAYPPDLTNVNGVDTILLDQVSAGPPYTLWGKRTFGTMHPTLRAAEQLHGVMTLRRKNTGVDVVPTDAGTISRASNSWVLPDTTWNPLQIGSRLRMWVAADKIVGITNGNTFTPWVDSSGNLYDPFQATAGNRPTYRTNQLNGLPSADFDGSNDFMSTSLSASNISQTVAVMARLDTSAAVMTLMGASANGGWHIGANSTRTAFIKKANVSTMGTTVGTFALAVSTFFVFTTTATTWEISINGTVESGTHAIALTGSLTAEIGAHAAATLPWDGNIYEVIVSDAQTSQGRQYLEGYLAWKWGKQAALPSTHPYKNVSPKY